MNSYDTVVAILKINSRFSHVYHDDLMRTNDALMPMGENVPNVMPRRNSLPRHKVFYQSIVS